MTGQVVENVAISPWHTFARLTSPNGMLLAEIIDAGEIAMGAPTSGSLVLSNGMRRDRCNPSMVWSDDSRFLAVPEWTPNRQQRLMIISMEHRDSRFASGTYRVLELESFINGIVCGTDSPAYEPRLIEVDVRALFSKWGS